MAARNSFLKAVAGLVAVAVMSGSASAATSWVGGAGANATTRNAWFNSTNWAGGIPSSSNAATFGTATFVSPNLATTGTALGVTFSANAPSYTIGGQALTVGSNGIFSNSPNAQTFNNTVQIGANLQVGGSSSANVINFKTINSAAQGNVVTVSSVTANFVENNPTTIAPEITIGSGGVVNVLNGSGSGSTFGDVIVNGGGKLDIADNTFVSAETYTGQANSTTEFDLAYAGGAPSGAYISTTGDVTYGGNLVFNWGAASLTDQASFTNYTDTWNVFQSGGAILGSIGGVTMTGVGSNNAFFGYTTFQQNGNEWTTQATPNAAGQWLVFQQDTGNLVVVPEPSTIVFAGVGVAMAGWSAWKKRRLAKVLAKK